MITSYNDHSAFGKREYRLEGDAVHVEGEPIWGTKFKLRIELRNLDPNYDDLRLQSPLLKPLINCTVVGIGGTFFSTTSKLLILPLSVFMLHCFLVFSGCFGTLSLRRIHTARFKNRPGFAVLDVFEAGPKKANFLEFISTLQAEIKKLTVG